MIHGFYGNIEEESLQNDDFRKVIYTGTHSQLVLMSLKPNEEIGEETHPDNDQFMRVEKGEGKCVINGVEHELKDGMAILVPAGAKHNVMNTSSTEHFKLYTLYSPPHHLEGVIHETKKEAESDTTDEFDGETSE